MAPPAIGFLGLDDLTVDLAAAVIRKGFLVQAFAFEGAAESAVMERIVGLGGVRSSSPMDVARDVAALVLLPCRDQINSLFGQENFVEALQKDTLVFVRSTVTPALIQKLEKHLADAGVMVVIDAYVWMATSGPSTGKIMICASGKQEATVMSQHILSAMSENVWILSHQIGNASRSRLVIELLEGIHLASSVEAMFLGARAGIHPRILYNIISNAAGSSQVFIDFVPKILKGDVSLRLHLLALVEKLGDVINMAKLLKFPLPLLAMAQQLLAYGSSYLKKDIDNNDPIEAWERLFGVNIRKASAAGSYSPENLADQVIAETVTVTKVGFIGLGAMGFGMATHLLRSGFQVHGYDVYKPTLSRFADAGGLVGNSLADVSTDVDVLVVMVANEAQAEDALFRENGAVSCLPVGATIIVSSTVSPDFVTQLEDKLRGKNKSLKLIDAPVSGGVKRAAEGTLTIMASGSNDALKCGGSVLAALSEKLYIIKGGCGAGSSVKMINQLLAGVHIAASAEAMAFGARMDLNARLLYEVIMNSRGNSWMFGNRVPHMLDNDYTPYSAVDIFVKDLGIVTSQSASLNLPVFISSIAHQQFISGSASGWGRLDDAAVVKVYETLTGVKIEGKPRVLIRSEVLRCLPPEWPEDITQIPDPEKKSRRILIVLDDDPTGTQTVHDIEVLTEWTIESVAEQFHKCPACFFILTNSRALNSEKASLLIKDICKNIDTAAKLLDGIKYTIVLRGDSTLRGHFPEELDAAISVLGEMDAWIICPFFLQGGRYTINDIHYVAESDKLVPAGETEFAKDSSFGYKASNLCDWVEEKTKGRICAKDVKSISLQLLREGGPDAVCEHLLTLPKGSTCIVNAASERDMAVFAAGMIQAENRGKRFLCRTAASFVSACIGIRAKDPLGAEDLGTNNESNGGLIVVGSYVPKTTMQVEELKSQFGHKIKYVEVSAVEVSLKSMEEREEEIARVSKMVDSFLKSRKDTLVMTSRNLVRGKNPLESLEINSKVSSALVNIVQRIKARPRYILAKGGITSSDIATKALMARRAKVVGQALAGVPLWLLGPESKHPGVPYIVFPGNVGSATALAEVVQKWAQHIRELSTKDILHDAKKGGYAVGAFNIYNLEGVEAVVAAAEAERSPAILQIHPGSLKLGGVPLIACCISAAEKASVPIAVHFDHGTSEQEIIEVLDLGFHSVMVDGSQLSYRENINYTKYISHLAHSRNMMVEAELGRLSGTEDDLTVEDYEARLTDPVKAQEFINQTKIDALAVCIGNVHGAYPASGPNLRLDLLKDLHALTSKMGVFLVLHGASGLSKELIQECIDLGVRKFNVNTEVRKAYVESLQKPNNDLVQIMVSAKEAMKAVIMEKMRLFGSSGKA